MHIYDCRLGTFIPQATTGQMAEILRSRFVDKMDQNPSESEIRSWRNSLGAFAEAVNGEGMDDTWIVLEYQLPFASSRIDAMVLGTDDFKKGNAVLIEFKQWERCQTTHTPEVVRVGDEDHLHPCAQVSGYRQYLQEAHSAFVDGGIGISSCAYLHNVKRKQNSHFFAEPYNELLLDSPAFCLEDVDALSRYLSERTGMGAPVNLVESVLTGRYRPSKKLLNYVADTIAGYEPWKLLDGQRLVFDKVIGDVESAKQSGDKQVIVVTGGPGTGKSVVALQIIGATARKNYVVAHATGSKAFTTTLRGIVKREGEGVFKYFYHLAEVPANSIDLVVCDEAHRLRDKSDSRFKVISPRPQEQDIIDSSNISVFLLDDQQSVRANETGSVSKIVSYADSRGIPVKQYKLETQFRLSGSDSYLRWIEYVLGLSDTTSLAWKRNAEYDVKVFGGVEEMESALRVRMTEGYSARMVAGFCWPWSKMGPTGDLAADVQIGKWARPWNRRPGAEPAHRNPYTLWATKSESFSEVGCIYSAQGFEFDYVGVIVGEDLRWDDSVGRWIVDLKKNTDTSFKRGLALNAPLALEKLQHIYRVLSTRGMKGTYFYFLDEATRHHFEQAGAVLE
jgi:uncharacterized protein